MTAYSSLYNVITLASINPPRNGFRALAAGLLALAFSSGINLLEAQAVYATPYTITTLAGTAGQVGTTDGTGKAARFDQPTGVAVDASGNVFVADTLNNTIREITTGGVVTTFAGVAGTSGSQDGTGSGALFNQPLGLAIDASGNIYVADSGNNSIRKITSAGVVTTLAGQAGVAGFADGVGSAAQFSFPASVAVDSAGNVYVADYFNDTIREIAPNGTVTTLAGTPQTPGSTDGTGGGALFHSPTGVAVDASGNVYVADNGNDVIRKITTGGVVTTFAGLAGTPGNIDATGSAARLNFPVDVAVDGSGNIYVNDASSLVREISPAGAVTTLAGRYGIFGTRDGIGSTAQFSGLADLASDASGNLYIADAASHTIRMGTPNPTADFATLPFQNDTLLGALTLDTSFLPTAFQGLGTVTSGWQERAVGDVNGDGIPDLIFQQGTQLGAWLLDDSGNPVTWVNIGAMNSGWELRGAGLITADGNLDLVFKNGTMLGFLEVGHDGTPLTWNGIGEMNAGWELHAVADLNNDGQPDLLFQNGTLLGALQIGTNGLPTAWNGIGAMNAGWILSYAVDVNADGQPDLIFQNGTGLGAVQVNASFVPTAWTGIGGMGSGWVLPGDY